MKKRTDLIKIIMAALALAIALSAPAPEPVVAASSAKMAVELKSGAKNAKLSKKKLTVHTKAKLGLAVKAQATVKKRTGTRYETIGGSLVATPVYTKTKTMKDVTAKATYRTSNKKVVAVDKKGRLTPKRDGTATVTVKYKGQAEKVKVTVSSKHDWKAHKKTVKVKRYHTVCLSPGCGKILEPEPLNGCPICGDEMGLKYCYCKINEHLWEHYEKGEMNNYGQKLSYEKVTYTDYYLCACGAKKASGEKAPESDKINIGK